MRRVLVSMLILYSPFLLSASLAGENTAEIERILTSFAEDFESDPYARDGLWGFEVDGERWHMTIRTQESGPAEIDLAPGFPETALVYWVTDFDTLQRIDRGMTGETATARANADDPVPLYARATENFPRYLLEDEGISKSFSDRMVEFKQYFFVRGTPEIIDLDLEHSRLSHDVNIVSILYAPGVRAFYSILTPGMHANKKPEDQIRDFPSLLVVTKGRMMVKIGGVERELKAGQTLRIPPNVTDEYWNPFDENAEGVMLIWGPKA